MIDKFAKFIMTSGSIAMLSTGALATVPEPASANATQTILSAAAAVGALILYNNYQHRQQQANAIVGYTSNGGTVYGDGRIAMPNGQAFYPNSRAQYPTGEYAYYSPHANLGAYRYDYDRTGRFDRTGRHHNNGNGWNGNGSNNANWHRGDDYRGPGNSRHENGRHDNGHHEKDNHDDGDHGHGHDH